MDYDVLVVGAGLSGATIAEHVARHGFRVLVIDKRPHIAGNCYDEIDTETGIRINRYGAHIFHTEDEEVWNYVNRFGTWRRWDHRVVADVSGRLINLPININTINNLFNLHIKTPAEAEAWFKSRRIGDPASANNSEDSALARIGPEVYNLIFRDYTSKQWGVGASELEPSVLERIPLRYSFDDRYFSDRFQGLPVDGYTTVVQQMLNSPRITVHLNTDWDAVKDGVGERLVVFTGPIDRYFADSGLPPLQYRSIQFDWKSYPNKGFHQPNAVVNYPLVCSGPSTRTVEYKHFLNQKSDYTIIASETTCDNGEPYYPIPNAANRELYKRYAILAGTQKKVYFIGRLANYKYFNMDAAIRNAMDYFQTYVRPDLETIIADGPALMIDELGTDKIDTAGDQ